MSTIKFYKDSNGAFRITDCTGKLAYINKGDIVSAYAENGVCSMIFSDEVYNRFTNIHNKNTAITDFVNASSVAYNEAGLNAVLSDFFVKSAGGISSGVEVINALGYTPENAAKKGASNGYAPLDSSSKVPAANLPSALAVGAIETIRSQSTDKAVASKLFDDTITGVNKKIASNSGNYNAKDTILGISNTVQASILKNDGTIYSLSGYAYDIYDVSKYTSVKVTITDGTANADPWSAIWQVDSNSVLLSVLKASDTAIPYSNKVVSILDKTAKIYVQRKSSASSCLVSSLGDDLGKLSDSISSIQASLFENSNSINSINSTIDSELFYLRTSLINSSNVIQSGLLDSDGRISGTTINGYNLDVYNVNGKKRIRIINSGGPTNDPWGLYSIHDLNGNVLYHKKFSDIGSGNYDITIDISGGNTLYVSRRSNPSVVYADDGNMYSQIEDLQNLVGGKTICCWGDSLTWGQGSVNTPYPKQLESLINDEYVNVLNCGVQGNTTKAIIARMGGLGLFVSSDITIPADTTEVELNLKHYSPSSDGVLGIQTIYGDSNSKDRINPVTINGVQYIIRYGAPFASGYSIRRISAGSTTTSIKSGSKIITYGASLSSKSRINIFYCGQNDTASFDTLFPIINQGFKFTNSKKNLFISSAIARTESAEIAAEKEYGSAYINLYQEMSTRGISIAKSLNLIGSGIGDSAWNVVDTTCVNGLMYDGIHWNEVGYKVLGYIVYERLKSLGWI